jgi:succinate-semialdehyde dehydrogenase/glutarate-semialdehyde dehydrogenase
MIGIKQSNLARIAIAIKSLKVADHRRLLTSYKVDHLQNANLWKTSGYIGGQWTDGKAKGKFSVKNPTNGEIIAELPRMNAADVAAAGKISYTAWKKWSKALATERSKIIRKMATLMGKYREDLAAIITLESGKPFSQSQLEVDYAKGFLLEYAEEAKRITGEVMEKPLHGSRVLTIKQAVGPAALITPWNFPSASKFSYIFS